MITNNLSEIINVVVEKSKENKLEHLSSDDIRNISLILWGYLRLIKSNFKTKDDSSEPSDDYYAHLKSILGELTTIQLKLINKIKNEFIDNFNSEMDLLENKIDSIPSMLALKSKKEIEQVVLRVSNLKKFSAELRKKLDEELHDQYSGFKLAIMSCYALSLNIKEIMLGLSEYYKELSYDQEMFQKTLTSHLKKMTYWSDIELTNRQCISYVRSGEFIDFLINS